MRHVHGLQLLLKAAGSKGAGYVIVRVVHGIQRDEYPEHVEEDEVHPHVHEVASIEVDVAGEPFGAKGHEACASCC